MADTVRILSTLALKGAVHRLADQYEASTATQIDADFAPTLALLGRLRGGENADVVILTREGLDALSDEGRVVKQTKVDLARSYVGIAVRHKALLAPISRRNQHCARPCSALAQWPIRGSRPAAFSSRN